MKAWVLKKTGDIAYTDVDVREPGEGEARIRVKAAGICGSDIPRIFETGAHVMPLIPGHEFSGYVEDTGEGVDDKWKNKRVGIFPLLYCGRCRNCINKRYELCKDYSYIGSRCDGAFAEYVNVPAENLIELPEEASFETGAMLEPMAVAVHAMAAGVGKGENALSKDSKIAVCGLGTIGLLLVMFLLDAGYENLYVIGNKDFQKNEVLKQGIREDRYIDSRREAELLRLDSRDEGVEVFFECVGRNETVKLGLDCTGSEGRVVLVGNPRSDMALDRNTYWKILRNQLSVTGIWNSSFTGSASDDWHYAAGRLAQGKIKAQDLITHRFELKELDRGLKIMRDRSEDYCKIMILQ